MCGDGSSTRRPSKPSDQSLADILKEILGISPRLIHDPRIVAMFDFCLLKYKFHRDLRSVSSLYQRSGTLDESDVSIALCFWLRRRQAGGLFANVLAKFRGGQPVISTFGVSSAKQCGDRESP